MFFCTQLLPTEGNQMPEIKVYTATHSGKEPRQILQAYEKGLRTPRLEAWRWAPQHYHHQLEGSSDGLGA